MEYSANNPPSAVTSVRRRRHLYVIVDMIETAQMHDDEPRSIAESVARMKADAARIAAGG